ncbi:Protein BZZ1 [Coemansia erecta]|uniref:Protein BZZ1 n=1 Tax=Coemansia erecta TaxID=147472 RepID=A0A9W8CR74_9FUNG|nr:Protein BZZ1 [Coemansia erecta]
MTFGSELKPNEFGAINGHVEKQLDVYGGLARLLADKAAAEKEYGRKVLDLARGFQTQLATLYDGNANALALTEVEASAATPLELLPAAQEWALNLEEEGRLHVQLASKISGDIADELRTAFEALGDTRKRNLEFYQRLLAERDRTYEHKDRARTAYETKARALGVSQQKQERATTEKDQDRHRVRADKDASARNQAKNEYILQVSVANAVKHAVNHTFTPRIMDAMQTVDERRVAAAKRLLEQLLAMQDSANTQHATNTRRAMHVVGRVDTTVDAAQFVRRRVESGASSWEEQPDFRVVVDLASGDNDSMVLDGESQVVLRNICLQAQRDGLRAESEARDKALTAEQTREKALAGGAAGSKGCERELESAAASEREATLAELEAVQHRALSAAVEAQLGAVDSGSPHDFKAFTVAISKTCDYCSESIGGLNRKAFRCTECEYTCHAKCQIKVEPSCPGKDPEAKSGFLSLFGSKRRGSRAKGARQRSQSTTSAGSAASVDAAGTPPMPPPRNVSQQQHQPLALYGSGSVSTSASQTSLPARPSLSYGAATLPRMAPMPDLTATVGRAGMAHDTALVPVLYDFEGDGSTTLSVKSGERVRVVEPDRDGSGWTEVTLAGGQQGLVPTSYVDMTAYQPPPAALMPPQSQPQSQPMPEARALMPPPAHALAFALTAPTQYSAPSERSMSLSTRSFADEYVVALYDFAGRDADELSVAKGDRIRVVSREIGDGWIQGALPDGREGRLPTSYVREQ